MDRDSQLTPLRPQLLTLNDAVNPKCIEAFQNEVLRPILKFQSPFTLALIKTHPHFSEELVKRENQRVHLTSICKEVRFQNQLIGSIIGLMTILELEVYCLLYTSPSPRDQRGSRMPSSA